MMMAVPGHESNHPQEEQQHNKNNGKCEQQARTAAQPVAVFRPYRHKPVRSETDIILRRV
jgi:hypothetical protein